MQELCRGRCPKSPLYRCGNRGSERITHAPGLLLLTVQSQDWNWDLQFRSLHCCHEIKRIVLLLMFKDVFVYFREKGSTGGRGREKKRESQEDSLLSAEPHAGFNVTT